MLTHLTLQDRELAARLQRAPEFILTRINLFCGPNGTGKSTVISGFRDLVFGSGPMGKPWTAETAPLLAGGECKAAYFFDTETDNLRTARMDDVFDPRTLNRYFDSKEMSHGQSNYRSLEDILAGDRYDVVVLDQPEAGLDVDGQLWLYKEIVASGKQFVIATHSPILLQLARVENASAHVFGKDENYLERLLKVYSAVLAGKSLPQPAKRVTPAALARKKR